MPNIRSKNEEELYELVEKCTAQPAGGTAQAQQEKQLHLGLTELTLRSQKALNESINALNTSSKKYARILVFLTWVLVVLTVVLVLPTVVPMIASGLRSIGISN